MIGEPDGSGGVSLLGHGTHASAGIRSGEVSDLEALSGAIGKTVQIAEREAGLSVQSASVVVPGGKPVSSINKQSLTLSDAIVRRRDIDRLMARNDPTAVPAGYQPMQSDPLGLLYDLRAPAVILGAQWRSRLGPVLGFQFSALDLSDADPYFRNRARTGQARFYGVELFFYRKGLSLELSYGNFRINGQSARSDGRIQELVLWDGQNAIPAQYVHYSGLGLQWRSQDVRLDFQAYGSHGQQSARTAFGGEEFLSRKTIRGWMVGGRFLWRIFEDSEIGFAGLGSSRQRKDADDFHGFGALNPRPRLLGGLGSILLYARPPFDQSHPMSNMRFYDGFPSDHYSQNSRNVDSGQMRRDMVIPDHGNRGIRMAGIQWSTELSYPRFLDLGWNELAIHLNRAEFKDAQGTEAVAILHYDLGFLEFTLSAAGAYITPAAESPNPYTGLIPSSKRRFFSRYGFAFSAKY